MTSQSHPSSGPAAWKDLVTQLPGILGAEFNVENLSLIHI